MNRIFVIGLLALVWGTASVCASAFDDANGKFKAGDFAGAAAAYEKILTTDGPDAAVYYNLGNSYQQLKRYGPAILAYERARLLTPHDPDLLANLDLARKAAVAFVDNPRNPRLEAALNFLSRNEWSWLVAGAALILGSLALLRGVVRPTRIWQRRCVLISGGLVGFLIATGATVLYVRHGEADRGIVLTDSAAVRLSPFEKAEVLGTYTPGHSVRLGLKNADFRYVEISGTNLQGWMSNKDVSAIVP